MKLTANDGTDGLVFNWTTAGGAEFVKEMLDRYMLRTLEGRDLHSRKKSRATSS